MHAPAADRERLLAFAVAVGVALVAWNNVVLGWLPHDRYVPANALATVVLLAAARGVGLTWAELGLQPRRMPSGLRWGGVAFALVAGGYLLALAVPATRPLLADARVADLEGGEVLYRVLVRYPVGTALWEEVAFRGVLLAALARVLPLRQAIGASAAVFGLWHVRPALGAIAANDLVTGLFPTVLAVLLAVAAAGVAGLVLTWLRVRSGSLLAPVLLHIATNSLGTIAVVAASGL